MKATIDIPDDLYRRVKARSALEGRPLRAVALQLFQDWLQAPPPPKRVAAQEFVEDTLTQAELDAHPWLAIARPYVRTGMNHDMDDIREAIATGVGADYAEKLAAHRS